MRWHTVGGRLRSTKHSRRLVKKRWRQTRTTFSTALASARPCWTPDAVPTVMAVAEAGRREHEMTAATAMAVKYRCMATISEIVKLRQLGAAAASAQRTPQRNPNGDRSPEISAPC